MISTDWDDDAGTMKYEKNNYSVAQRSGKYKCCFIFSCGLLFAFVSGSFETGMSAEGEWGKVAVKDGPSTPVGGKRGSRRKLANCSSGLADLYQECERSQSLA